MMPSARKGRRQNYTKFITDHSDALSRRALLDINTSIGGNVVVIEVRRVNVPASIR
jgi:hypothetical protein